MVSKCSNPTCSAHFLYLHAGKLFRFQAMNDASTRREIEQKATKGIEFFWLCEECSGKFTLESDVATGVRVVALHRRAMGAAATL